MLDQNDLIQKLENAVANGEFEKLNPVEPYEKAGFYLNRAYDYYMADYEKIPEWFKKRVPNFPKEKVIAYYMGVDSELGVMQAHD